MGANFPARRRPAGDQEPTRQGGDGEARLWRIGTALAVSFTVAVVGLVGLAWLAWVLLGAAGFRRHGPPALHDTVGILQLVFASVAGAGALVALIVAYRRQKVAEADSAHDRTRVFNERFTTIAAQLGDAQPAVRLAGVHAMAGLADDWKANRQTCIDVLCAYLRLPYEPDPGEEAPAPERLAFRASREVRHTVIRVITAHLSSGATVSWQGLNFDFTGVVFDGGSFATPGSPAAGLLHRRRVLRRPGQLRRRRVLRRHGQLQRRRVHRRRGQLHRRQVLRRQVSFSGAQFSGGEVNFNGAEFSGSTVAFSGAGFSGGKVNFSGAEFSGGTGQLQRRPSSPAARSASAAPGSPAARSASAAPSSPAAGSTSAAPGSPAARSTSAGASSPAATVNFSGAGFSGGTVDFTAAETWSHPPLFDWTGKPPAGVTLPTSTDVTP